MMSINTPPHEREIIGLDDQVEGLDFSPTVSTFPPSLLQRVRE
jgi:hypothetical protein